MTKLSIKCNNKLLEISITRNLLVGEYFYWSGSGHIYIKVSPETSFNLNSCTIENMGSNLPVNVIDKIDITYHLKEKQNADNN